MQKKFIVRYKQCLFFCLALAMGCTQHPKNDTLADIENQYLERFFRYLFETTTAGYVFYGEKPFLICPFKSIENTIPGSVEHRDAVLINQGIEAWKKLNVQSQNFLLVPISNNKSELTEAIVLINKKAFHAVIEQNLSLFQFKLGPHINEQNLLNGLLSPNGFSTLFKGHQALQGILFGYGVENSLTYERATHLRKKASDFHQVNPPFQYNQDPKTPDDLKKQITAYADNQEGEQQNILDELVDFSFYIPKAEDSIIPKIPFSYHTESEESKKLLDAYKEAEKTLVELQKQPDFLSKVIERLKR